MSDIPPFPNSVNAVQQVPKHQVQKIDIERMQARETNAKQEIVTTISMQKYTLTKEANSVRLILK